MKIQRGEICKNRKSSFDDAFTIETGSPMCQYCEYNIETTEKYIECSYIGKCEK